MRSYLVMTPFGDASLKSKFSPETNSSSLSASRPTEALAAEGAKLWRRLTRRLILAICYNNWIQDVQGAQVQDREGVEDPAALRLFPDFLFFLFLLARPFENSVFDGAAKTRREGKRTVKLYGEFLCSKNCWQILERIKFNSHIIVSRLFLYKKVFQNHFNC